jgi:hypothetical protein
MVVIHPGCSEFLRVSEGDLSALPGLQAPRVVTVRDRGAHRTRTCDGGADCSASMMAS